VLSGGCNATAMFSCQQQHGVRGSCVLTREVLSGNARQSAVSNRTGSLTSHLGCAGIQSFDKKVECVHIVCVCLQAAWLPWRLSGTCRAWSTAQAPASTKGRSMGQWRAGGQCSTTTMGLSRGTKHQRHQAWRWPREHGIGIGRQCCCCVAVQTLLLCRACCCAELVAVWSLVYNRTQTLKHGVHLGARGSALGFDWCLWLFGLGGERFWRAAV
jgi:hypothetical protein